MKYLRDIVLIIVGVFFFFASVLVLTWIVNARGVHVEEKLNTATQKLQASTKTSEQAKAEAKAAIDVATHAEEVAKEASQKKGTTRVVVNKSTMSKLNWLVYQNRLLQEQINALSGRVDALDVQIKLLQKERRYGQK